MELKKNETWLILVFLFFTYNLKAQENPSIYSKTAKILEEQYYEPGRFVPTVFWKACIERLQFIIPALELKQKENLVEIFYEGQAKGSVKISLTNINDTFKSCEDLYQALEAQITDTNKIILQESPFEVIQEGLKTLDPHTKIFTPEQSEIFLQRNQNQQYGVGFVLTQNDDKVLIQSIIEGSPAEAAGLREGDIIIELNNILLPGPTIKELQKQIDQAENKIAITVEKFATHNIEKLSLAKEALNTKAVESFLINEEIGYFRFQRFSEGCFDQFLSAMRVLESGKGTAYFLENGKWKKENNSGGVLQIQSYIIDLRGNPGGLLNEAVRLCDYFLNNGKNIVSVKGSKGQNQVYMDTKGGSTKKPLVILIDGKSASASEIVSGCLQRYNRALIVGSPSFGKGSVQQMQGLQDLKGSFAQTINPLLKVSVAEYFVADDEPIQNRGVLPNVELIPADLTVGNIRLLPIEINRESDYETKLNSQDNIKRVNVVQYDQILYIDDKAMVVSKMDVPIAICTRLLEGDGPFENDDWKNTEFYARKKDLCKIIKSEESSKLIDLLNKQGIPWEKGGEFSSNLKAELEVVNFDESIKADTAKTFRLKVFIKNKSNIPSFGVKGRINFESIHLPTNYLFWGKIKEQELREAIVDIPIKNEFAGGTYPFVITISDENGDLFTLRRKLIITMPEKSNVALSYKISKNENNLPEKNSEKYSLLLRIQNESDRISVKNEMALENLRKETYSLIEVMPSIQSNIPLGKNEGNEAIELKYDISIQKSELFKDQLPFRLRFRDFNSRQQLQTTLNFKKIKPNQDWSIAIKELPVEFLPAPTLGLMVLDATGALKVTLPGKSAIQAIYATTAYKKIFYKKLDTNSQNEKETVILEFPKTKYPTVYSLFLEMSAGATQENIICIQNQLPDAPIKK